MKFSEDVLQVTMARYLAKVEAQGIHPMTYAADQNAARRGRTAGPLAKLMGMRRGETDLRIYLPEGRLISIEVKKATGRMSTDQLARHQQLEDLGFTAVTIWASSPPDAVYALRAALREQGVDWAGEATSTLAQNASDEVLEALGIKNDTGGLAKLADNGQLSSSSGDTE